MSAAAGLGNARRVIVAGCPHLLSTAGKSLTSYDKVVVFVAEVAFVFAVIFTVHMPVPLSHVQPDRSASAEASCVASSVTGLQAAADLLPECL